MRLQGYSLHLESAVTKSSSVGPPRSMGLSSADTVTARDLLFRFSFFSLSSLPSTLLWI